MKFVLVASTPESIIPFRGKLIKELCNLGINVHICAPFTNKDSSIVQELRDNYCVDTHTTPLGKAGTNVLSDFRYLMRLIEIIKLVIFNNIFLGHNCFPLYFFIRFRGR